MSLHNLSVVPTVPRATSVSIAGNVDSEEVVSMRFPGFWHLKKQINTYGLFTFAFKTTANVKCPYLETATKISSSQKFSVVPTVPRPTSVSIAGNIDSGEVVLYALSRILSFKEADEHLWTFYFFLPVSLSKNYAHIFSWLHKNVRK